MPIASIDYILAATLRATGLSYAEIAQQLGAKAQSIRVGLSRRGLNKPATQAREGVIRRATETAELAIQQASKDSRSAMAESIARDVDWLNDAPATRNALAVYTRYTRLAPLLAAAERVYGWRADDSQAPTLSMSRVDLHVHHDDESAPVIDVGTPSASALDDAK